MWKILCKMGHICRKPQPRQKAFGGFMISMMPKEKAHLPF